MKILTKHKIALVLLSFITFCGFLITAIFSIFIFNSNEDTDSLNLGLADKDNFLQYVTFYSNGFTFDDGTTEKRVYIGNNEIFTLDMYPNINQSYVGDSGMTYTFLGWKTWSSDDWGGDDILGEAITNNWTTCYARFTIDDSQNGIKYKNDDSRNFLIAYGYDQSISSNVVIPDTIDGWKVTEIANASFKNNTYISSLFVGNNIKTIGGDAFNGCTSLSSLSLGSKVETIHWGAFQNCTSLLGALNIPKSLVTIENSAFSSCGFTNINIGSDSNLTSIGTWAFTNCTNLTGTVFLPPAITILSTGIFNDCPNLKEVIFGNTITEIGDQAFNDCHSLELDLVIPQALIKIGNYAFSNCSNVINSNDLVFLNVINIGEQAFVGSGITGNIELPKIVSIDYRAFYQTSIESLSFGDTIESIGIGAFQGSNLTGDISFGTNYGENIITIGNEAFAGLSISIQNQKLNLLNIIKIGDYAFNNTQLSGNITLGNSLQIIGANAFSSTSFTNSDTISFEGGGQSITIIGEYAFNSVKAKITSSTTLLDLVSIERIGSFAFYGSGIMNNITFGSGLIYIEQQAFLDTALLPSNTIIFKDGGPNIKSIAYAAFKDITATIKSSTTDGSFIFTSLISIGGNAFEGSNFTGTMIFGDFLESIDSYAFSNCTNLTGSIVFPATINKIGNGTFDTTSFTSLTIEGNASLTIGTWAFANINTLLQIDIKSEVLLIDATAFGGTDRQDLIVNYKNTTSMTTLINTLFINSTKNAIY